MRSTGDGMFDLIAATFRQAIADARSGDTSAIAWLDMTAPDWRTMDRRKARKPYRHPASARYKKDVQTMHKGEACSNLSESQNLRSRLRGAPIATSGASRP
jgi:hypothetical protein